MFVYSLRIQSKKMKHILVHALLANIVDFFVEKVYLAIALTAVGSFRQEDKCGFALSGRGPLVSHAGGRWVAWDWVR